MNCGRLLLGCLLLVGSATASAAPLEFVVDPAASQLRVWFGNVVSSPQTPGSDLMGLSGSLMADVTPTSLQFLTTSDIRFAEQVAPQSPLANGALGESPANFGLNLNSPDVLVGVTAGRGLVGDAVSPAIDLVPASTAFDATQVQFDLVSGSIAYNVMYFIDPKAGATDVFFQYPNTAAGGQLDLVDGLYTITLPLMVSGLVNVEGGNIRIRYQGVIVARQVPEPGSLMLLVLGLPIVAAAARKRSRE